MLQLQANKLVQIHTRDRKRSIAQSSKMQSISNNQ